jgi:hypothetical protein
MGKTEYDEIIDLAAKHFVKIMDKKDWLGKALEEKGFDLAEISDDEAHTILLKSILKLYDAFEEDIEIEEEEELDEDEDEEDEEAYLDDDDAEEED